MKVPATNAKKISDGCNGSLQVVSKAIYNGFGQYNSACTLDIPAPKQNKKRNHLALNPGNLIFIARICLPRCPDQHIKNWHNVQCTLLTHGSLIPIIPRVFNNHGNDGCHRL